MSDEDRLKEAVLSTSGDTSRADREAAMAFAATLAGPRTPPPGPAALEPLLHKMAEHAYKVVDEDIDSLREALSEHAIFELVVASATGSGLARLDQFDAVVAGMDDA